MSAEYCEDHDVLMDDHGCWACTQEIAMGKTVKGEEW